MDRNDAPLRILVADLGDPLPLRDGSSDGAVVTRQSRANTVAYFRRSARAVAEWEARVPADGPERAPLHLDRIHHPNGWSADPGVSALRNDFPAAIAVGGRSYPTVSHAYWALSTSDPALHDRIVEAPGGVRGAGARRAGTPGRMAGRAVGRAGRVDAGEVRPASRAGEILLATGDARIIYRDVGSAYWCALRDGTNWVGRLLEVIRSEVAAGSVVPGLAQKPPER